MVYQKGECGGNGTAAEYIAQARAIAWMNMHDKFGHVTQGVSPNLQWEVEVGMRPDIVRYDYLSGQSGNMYVTEAKGAWNGNAAKVAKQITGGIDLLAAATGRHVQPDTYLMGEDYNDFYEIEVGVCPGTQIARYDTYSVRAEIPGLLWVEKTAETTCGLPAPLGQTRSDPHEQSDDLPIERIEDVTSDLRLSPANKDQVFGNQPINPLAPSSYPVGDPATQCKSTICVTADEAWATFITGVGADMIVETNTLTTDLWEQIFWNSPSAYSYGDPHLATLDGLQYDLQSVGEFQAAISEQRGLNLQVRASQTSSTSKNWSTFSRVAFDLNGFVVELGNDGSFLLDGKTRTLPDRGVLYMGNGSALFRGGDAYYALAPGTEPRPMLRFVAARAGQNLQLWVPPSSDSDLVGLFGNADGIADNDLALRDGTPLPASASSAAIHGTFADSWRITDTESLFTYPPGSSTSTYTDRSYPESVITVGDLSPEEVGAASEICREAGVLEGPQFDDCVTDAVLTAGASFAASAAELVRPVSSGSDALLSESGDLAWDFESTLPSSISTYRIGSSDSTSRFAGPFSDAEGYGFYVPSIPSSDSVEIGFDVLAIGDWGLDPDDEKVSLSIGNSTVWESSVSALGAPTATGVLASGTEFMTYRASASLPATRGTLRAVFSGTSVNGLVKQGFGIDNISLSATLRPPQTFEISLPSSINNGGVNGDPISGSAELETAASEDIYTFTVGAGFSRIALSIQDCPAGGLLSWTLIDDAGATVASGECMRPFAEIKTGPGEYRLVVGAGGGPAGGYGLTIATVQPDVVVAGTTDGKPITVTTTAGQNGKITFTATAGQSIQTTCSQTTGLGWVAYTLRNSLGASVKTASCSSSGSAKLMFDTLTLPTAGEYTLTLDPENQGAGTATITITTVQPDVVVAGTTDGKPITVTTTAGQNGKITFTATAGQSIQTTCSQTTGLGWVAYTLRNSLGASVKTASCSSSGSAKLMFDTLTLSGGGTHTLTLDPENQGAGTATITITTK